MRVQVHTEYVRVGEGVKSLCICVYVVGGGNNLWDSAMKVAWEIGRGGGGGWRGSLRCLSALMSLIFLGWGSFF